MNEKALLNPKRQHYNKMFETSYEYTENKITTRLAKEIQLEKSNKKMKILEIGCGNGRNLEYLKKHVLHIPRLYGIELSDTGTKKAQAKNLNVLQASADNIPFRNNAFDFVFTVHALEQMKYLLPEACVEIARVTKRNRLGLFFEPFYCIQSRMGKLHNLFMDYSRGMHYFLSVNGFEGQIHPIRMGFWNRNRTGLLKARCRKDITKEEGKE